MRTVFVDKRHYVADRTERHEIEEPFLLAFWQSLEFSLQCLD